MSVNSISEIDQQEQRDNTTNKLYPETVSIEIFKNIKPLCVNLSQIALAPEGIFNSLQLVNALKSLEKALIDTAKNYTIENDGYSLIITTNLADYIFIPIASLLKRQNLKDAELEYVLSIIHFLLKYCWGSPGYLKKELSVQFLPLLTYLIAGSPIKNDKKPIVEKSEKTVNNGILALKELFIGVSKQNSTFKDEFFSDSRNLPPLGHLITVLLEISLNSSELDVQLNSLDTLKILYSTFNDSDFLSYIFPGNVSIISKIINSRSTSKKIHYTVIVRCFEILTILTKDVFNDFVLNTQLKNDKSEIENLNDLLLKAEKLTEDAERESTNDANHESHVTSTDEKLEVFIPETQSNTKGIKQRDTKWLEETVKNLRKAFKSILKVDTERKEIKISLLEFCYSVLKHNFQTLLSLIPDIVNAIGETIDLSSLTNDSESEDDGNNSTIINLVLLNVSEKHMKIFDLIVSRCFRSWLNVLSPSLISADAKIPIKLMNKLSFGLLILNCNEDSNLDELVELLIKSLRNELVELVQSENSNYIKTHSKVSTVNNKSLTSNSVESDILFIISNYSNNEIVEDKKNISLFHSLLIREVEINLSNFLKVISIIEQSSFICDQLIENVDGSSFNTTGFDNPGDYFESEKGSNNSNNNETQYFLILKSITIWLTSNILLAKKTKSQNVKDLVEMDDFLNFDEYEEENKDENELEDLGNSNELLVSYDSLYPILENSLEILENNSVREIDTPGYTKSSIIALNSISRASDIMGMDFKEELIDYLFPVIDLLASSNEMERITAQNTVINISKNCYNNSIHDLIFYNSDYLIDSLSVKLSSDLLTPRTPVILLVLIRIGGIEILNKLKEGILTTIFTLLDVYNHYSLLSESFFAIFNEIIESIYKNYFKNFDFKLLEFENDESSILNNDYEEERDNNFLKPWGMKNINQVLDLLEDKQKDIAGITESEDLQTVLKRHPNKPFEDAKDSDDEDSDDEDEDEMTELYELRKQLESRESESHPEDAMNADDDEDLKQLVRQLSPISKSMYLLLNQIFTYSDRLAMHDSIRLRLQILRLINRLIPILATSKDDVLPVLASTWPILKSYLDFSMNGGTGSSGSRNGSSLENLLDKEYSFGDRRSNIYNDFRIVELSCDCIETSFKFTGEFLSKNFLDLWEVLKTGFYHELFMIYESKRTADSKHGNATGDRLKKDTINSVKDNGAIGGAANSSASISSQQVSSIDYKLNIYKKISKMLIFGLNKFGKLIPNEITIEIIKMTIIVYNDINDYKYFSDIAWYLSQ